MSDAGWITITDTIDSIPVARKFRGDGRNRSYVRAIVGMVSEIERLRAATDRAISYLEGESPGITSGGIRNGELRAELIALRESR